MSNDDDITEQILDGDSYDEAILTVRRLFSLSLDNKILVATGTLAYTGALAPALWWSQGQIVTLEPEISAGETLNAALTGLVLLGILGSFSGGILLVRQQYRRHTQSFDAEQARRFIRIEDFLMVFVAQGALFVTIPTTAAVLGALFPDFAVTAYEHSIRIYRPHETAGIDAWIVSLVGIVFGVVLVILRQHTKNRSRREQ